jgi:hypothetical protein
MIRVAIPQLDDVYFPAQSTWNPHKGGQLKACLSYITSIKRLSFSLSKLSPTFILFYQKKFFLELVKILPCETLFSV